MPEVNYWAVLLATASAFILGGLWYSKTLFGKAWMAGSGMTEEKAAQGHPGKVFGGAFVLSFVAALGFAIFLGPAPELNTALITGVTVGAYWVATSFGINYLFEQKSLKLFLVNAGYHLAQFVLYGLVFGLWH